MVLALRDWFMFFFFSSSTLYLEPTMETLTDGSEKAKFKSWQGKKWLVLGWIKTTTRKIGYELFQGCATAWKAWLILDERLAPTMPLLSKRIRDELRYMKKKSDQSIAKYLNKVKSLYSILSNAGHTSDDNDITNTTILTA